MDNEQIQKEFKRIDGKLYQIFIIRDDQKKEVHRMSVPLKVELKIHGILEILVGASILAVPTAFTEEVWNRGDQLPWFNVLLLSSISFLFMGRFIYYTSYRGAFVASFSATVTDNIST